MSTGKPGISRRFIGQRRKARAKSRFKKGWEGAFAVPHRNPDLELVPHPVRKTGEFHG